MLSLLQQIVHIQKSRLELWIFYYPITYSSITYKKTRNCARHLHVNFRNLFPAQLLVYSPQTMNVISLQSGSNGNCIYVETNNISLLFDAGISGVQAERRLANHHLDIRKVDAVLISHEHSDHIRAAGIYGRKYGLPMFVTANTLKAATAKTDLGKLADVTYFESGDRLCFGDVEVETLPTPHDGVDGNGFVVAGEGKRLGILTDLGHPFPELSSLVATVDAVVLESNYDEEMLAQGPYPWPLKQRIKGERGHLSNREAAELLRVAGSHLEWAMLAHLSEQNNTPECALETSRSLVGDRLPLHVASRYEESNILVI